MYLELSLEIKVNALKSVHNKNIKIVFATKMDQTERKCLFLKGNTSFE